MEIEAEGKDWVMESIIASGPSDDDPRKHVFLVKSKFCSQVENTWETYQNVGEQDLKLLVDYNWKNPAVTRD
jgi:hypothetical protein